MIAVAWNNGAHSRNGSGYGFKITPDDREAYFKKEWQVIVLEIEGQQPSEVTLTPEFWERENHELHSKAVGLWLRKNGLAPWHVGNPPSFTLDHVEDNRFKIAKQRKGHPAFK